MLWDVLKVNRPIKLSSPMTWKDHNCSAQHSNDNMHWNQITNYIIQNPNLKQNEKLRNIPTKIKQKKFLTNFKLLPSDHFLMQSLRVFFVNPWNLVGIIANLFQYTTRETSFSNQIFSENVKMVAKYTQLATNKVLVAKINLA